MPAKKKTAAKKTAAKKAAKSFDEALGIKPPVTPILRADDGEIETTPSIVAKRPDAAGFPELTKVPADAEFDEGDFQEYGPLGENRVTQVGGGTISLEESDRLDGFLTDTATEPEEAHQEASTPLPGHTVKEAQAEALATQPLGQSAGEDFSAAILDKEQAISVVLGLIDGLNFLHGKGFLRKVAEKDIEILKARIKQGRSLIEALKQS